MSKILKLNDIENKEERNAKIAEILAGRTYGEARTALCERLEKALEGTEDEDDSIALLAVFLKADRAGSGTGAVRKDSKQMLLREFFIENKTANIMDIFQKFIMGPHEIGQASLNLRTKVADDLKVWIQKDESDETGMTYVLKGVGAEKPENWIERKRAKTIKAGSSPFEASDSEETEEDEE